MSRCDDLGPLELVSAAQVGTGGLGQRDVVVGVAAPDRGGVAVRFESLLGVLADASRAAGSAPRRRRCRRRRRATCRRADPTRRPHPARRGRRRPAPPRPRRDHSRRRTPTAGPARDVPSGRAGRRTSRSCSASVWWRSSAARLPRVRSLNRWSRRATRSSGDKRPHPRRRELDRQRDPVEAPAQHADRTGVAVGEREVVLRGASPDPRTAAPPPLPRAPSTSLSLGGNAERRHRDDPLARRARALLGSSRAPTPVAQRCVDRVDLPGDRIEEVLTVVEHEQQSLRRQILEHRLLEAAARRRLHPQTTRRASPTPHPDRRPARARTATHRRGTRRRPPPRPATRGGSCRRRRRRSGSPATTARTSSASAPISASRPTNVVDLARQVARAARPTTATAGTPPPDPGASTWNTRIDDREIAQPVLAQIDELDRLATRHAPPPRSRPRPPPARRAPTAISRAHRFSGRFTYSPGARKRPSSVCRPIRARNGPSRRIPILGSEPPLRVQHTGECVRRRTEHRGNPVAHLREHDAAVALDRLTQDRVVARQGTPSSPRVAPPTDASNPRDP